MVKYKKGVIVYVKKKAVRWGMESRFIALLRLYALECVITNIWRRSDMFHENNYLLSVA